MSQYDVLKRARDYYQSRIHEIFGITRPSLWTPAAHNIWVYTTKIVAQTYKLPMEYSARLEYIPEEYVEEANDLAISILDQVLNIEYFKNMRRAE